MKVRISKTIRWIRSILSRAHAKLIGFGRALSDITRTLWHGCFSAPQRQMVLEHVNRAPSARVKGKHG